MQKIIIILLHAFVGWALCGGVIAIGRTTTTMKNTLIIHAIAAPIIFAIISFIFFKKFNFTTPLQTAFIFVSYVIFMDFFLVALIIEKSFDMFKSILGTWIPIGLISLTTLVAGLSLKQAK